jgi:O-methyltransferase involved in polyketide biosynthesis
MWPPSGVNSRVAHNARVWDYWLGGRDNFAVDRQVGDEIVRLFPIIRDLARADRRFLIRVVRFLAGEAGIRQFLDIGTGLPTANNTHEVAQAVAPESRIVYVDKDPIVLVHARALLTSGPLGVTEYIDADIHEPDMILAEAARTLDFTQPVAVMLLGILNFVLDNDEAKAIVDRLMDAVPAGSYLTVGHPTGELSGGHMNEQAVAFWNEHAVPPIRTRTRAELARLLDGLELLEPGLVSLTQWRPDGSDTGDLPAVVPEYGALARRP